MTVHITTSVAVHITKIAGGTIVGFWSNKKLGKINASELSNQIKPIFESVYSICREFGYEDGEYCNFLYKDQNIIIRHSPIKNGTSDAFGPGNQVRVEYKGQCVFNCLIKLNGDIKLIIFESGEWKRHFVFLEDTLKLTLLAREKLEQYYKLNRIFYSIAQKNAQNKGVKNISYNYYRNCSFNAGKCKVNYDIENGYLFTDDKIKVDFRRDEKKNVASAAVITFKGKIVFNAVHFFPSNQRPFSSNTRCRVFERGEWEEYLINSISSFRDFYKV